VVSIEFKICCKDFIIIIIIITVVHILLDDCYRRMSKS
jgi:hypothetical protein